MNTEADQAMALTIKNGIMRDTYAILEGKTLVVAERIVRDLHTIYNISPDPSTPDAVAQLNYIDTILARRDALDNIEGRANKILAAIERAAEADRFERSWRNILASEHGLSAAYVRLREILGTLDIPTTFNPPTTDNNNRVWTYTEQQAQKLVDFARGVLELNGWTERIEELAREIEDLRELK